MAAIRHVTMAVGVILAIAQSAASEEILLKQPTFEAVERIFSSSSEGERFGRPERAYKVIDFGTPNDAPSTVAPSPTPSSSGGIPADVPTSTGAISASERPSSRRTAVANTPESALDRVQTPTPSPSGDSVAMPIQFDLNSAWVKPESYPAIQALAQYLWKYKEASIVIIGHTDATGSAEYNLELSLRRAESVKKVLIERFHVGFQRIFVEGYGEKRLFDVSNPYSSENRRVEFQLASPSVSASVSPYGASVPVRYGQRHPRFR